LGNGGHAIDAVADFYLGRFGGLSFDFATGEHQYQVVIGGSGADTLHGEAARDYLWGRGGADQIAGGAEDDILYGDAGADLLVGNEGRDKLDGGMGDDSLYGGDQADSLMGHEGDDYLDEGIGHGMLEGGAGDDTLVGGQGPDAFVVAPGSGNDVIRDFTAGPGMFDHLALRDLRWADLTITDTAGGALMSWNGGSVLLEGVARSELAQDDFMFAQTPDLPPGTRAPDGATPERATPSDPEPEIGVSTTTRLQESFDTFADFLSRHHRDAAFDFDTYRVQVGGAGRDVLHGGGDGDHVFGRGGADRLHGGGGEDVLQGDGGNDHLWGDASADRLDGGAGRDHLYGGDQADELMGGKGNDHLDAGAGHDMIEGEEGNDTIVGGTGADAFIVAPGSGNDVVLDFEATGLAQGAFDHIALRDIRPDQVTVADTAKGALVSWDLDGDSAADGSVLLQGVAKADLRQSDFMFVDEPGFVDGISIVGSYYIFPETIV
jgi:Ca2+-binding RTX toxin-like protein